MRRTGRAACAAGRDWDEQRSRLRPWTPPPSGKSSGGNVCAVAQLGSPGASSLADCGARRDPELPEGSGRICTGRRARGRSARRARQSRPLSRRGGPRGVARARRADERARVRGPAFRTRTSTSAAASRSHWRSAPRSRSRRSWPSRSYRSCGSRRSGATSPRLPSRRGVRTRSGSTCSRPQGAPSLRPLPCPSSARTRPPFPTSPTCCESPWLARRGFCKSRGIGFRQSRKAA